MIIYLAGHGHDIEATPFIKREKVWKFLVNFFSIDKARFDWAIQENKRRIK